MVSKTSENAVHAPSARGRSIGLTPLVVPKASEVLASDLRARILAGSLVDGTMLPPERELVEQTRLSRSTVRDALKILEIQGFVEIRPGRNGGAAVKRPTHVEVADTIGMFIQGRQLRLAALLEVRETIEPLCAALAAQRRSDEDLVSLDAWTSHMKAAGDDLPSYLNANLQWHLTVAEASHNELLAAFMHAISTPIYAGTNLPGFDTASVRTTAVRAHQRINEAIRVGDAATAERRMARHVSGFAGEARKRTGLTGETLV
jgi:DNA-binding FadR family transcriptional regulator